MLYRFNRLFNVSKVRAATVAILCAIAAIPFFIMGGFAGAEFGLMFLTWSFIYGCIWLYKFNRDKRIIERAKLEAIKQAPVQHMPEMTTPGSNRLFVPRPLDRTE